MSKYEWLAIKTRLKLDHDIKLREAYESLYVGLKFQLSPTQLIQLEVVGGADPISLPLDKFEQVIGIMERTVEKNRCKVKSHE